MADNNRFYFEETRPATTPEEMRKELFRLAHYDSLVRNVFDTANYNGLSGEDRYTILAYYALGERAKAYNRELKILSLTPQDIIIPFKREEL